MKKVLLILLLATLFIKCTRDKSDGKEIEGITGVSWEFFYLQKSSDTYIHPLPTGWQLQLQNNGMFTVKGNQSVGKGFYFWTQQDAAKARVFFTISNWTFNPADTAFTNRLRDVLEEIDSVQYLTPPYNLPFPISFPPGSRQLLFYGTGGSFYVK